MRTIDVDREVYGRIDERAEEWRVSHNQTLRRILGLAAHEATPAVEVAQASVPPAEPNPTATCAGAKGRRKQRKADLWELEDSGYINEGETFALKTAGGVVVPGYSAELSNCKLLRGGELYSMSRLARIGLNSVGKLSNSVRGPSHWYPENAGGENVESIWRRHLLNDRD